MRVPVRALNNGAMVDSKNRTYTQAGEARIKSEIRDHSQFLPAVHRTESLTRFFGGAIDHLLSSGITETMDTYWGRRSFGEGRTESWRTDPDPVRNAFQLAPGAVSRRDGKVAGATPYSAWIRRFEQAGGDASNHDRAFAEPGYVLDAPIDLDKFVNYSKYHWLPDGQDDHGRSTGPRLPHVVIEPVFHDSEDFTIEFDAPTLTVTMRNGMPHYFEDGDRVKLAGFVPDAINAIDRVVSVIDKSTFSVDLAYGGPDIRAKTDPGNGTVSGFLDMALVDGARAFTTGPVQFRASPNGDGSDGTHRVVTRIKLENGLRVAFRDDGSRIANMPSGVAARGLDSTIATDTIYEVRGIGREGITFCADQPAELYASVSLGPTEVEGAGTKAYVVQGKRTDGHVNPWIIRNRWVKESVVETAFKARHLSHRHRNLADDGTRGRRPIIEFNSGMRTWQGDSADGHCWDGPLVTSPMPDDESDDTPMPGSNSFVEGTLTWVGRGVHKGLYRYVNRGADTFADNLKPNKVGPIGRGEFPTFDVFLSGDPGTSSSIRGATGNDFFGDPVFRYKTDPNGTVDPELGFAPVMAADGTPMFEWTLGNARFHRSAPGGGREGIGGFYYWQEDGALRNGWSALRGGQRVPIMRTAESDGTAPVEIDLGTARENLSHPSAWVVTNDGSEIRWHSTADEADLIDLGSPNPDVAMEAGAAQSVTYVNPAGDTENLNILDYGSSSGTAVDISADFTPPADRAYDLERQYSAGSKTGRIHVLDRNMKRITVRHNGKWLDDSKWTLSPEGVLTLAEAVPEGNVVTVEYVTDGDVAGADYAVAPVHYFNNASDPFTGGSGRELSEHFESQMVCMPGFAGNPYAENNYSEIPRLHAYGGRIRQQWVDTLKLMHLMDRPAVNPVRGLRTVSRDYAAFLRHFRGKAAQLWRDEGFGSVRELVDRVLDDIHAGKDASFRYANSDMAYWRNSADVVHELAYDRSGLVTCGLPATRNEYGSTHNHLQVYLETGGVERMLVEGVDYTAAGCDLTLIGDGVPFNTGRSESFPTANVGSGTSITGTANTNTVRVAHAGHGFEDGEAVAFSGLAASSNQSFLDGINGNVFVVTKVSDDAFTFPMNVSGDVTISASVLNDTGSMQVRSRATLSTPVQGDPAVFHVRGSSRTRLESSQFTLSGVNLAITITGSNAVEIESGDTFEVYEDIGTPRLRIRRFPHNAMSFIPPSSVKLGFFGPTRVEASGRTIIGHDGTRHEVGMDITDAALRDVNGAAFDPVAAALFELERRIASNLPPAHHSHEDMAAMLPSAHRSGRHSIVDARAILAERFNVWAAANGVTIDRTAYEVSDPLTWNYESVEEGSGSWRALYHHHFGTDRPHTHPWEMLGHRTKPSWWDDHYSWTDSGQRAKLIAALRHGIVGEPPASGVGEVDVRFARHSYDWDSNTLVTSASPPVLNNPVAAGVVSAPSADAAAVPFEAGDWSEEEDAWRKGPEYPFAVAEALLRLRPFMTHAMWWRLGRLEEEAAWNGQWRDSATMARKGCPEIHNQLLEDGIVAEIAVESGGTGYVSNPAMAFPQAKGKCERAAGAKVYEKGGVIDAISITDPGRGYRASPTGVQPAATGGSGAVIEYTMDYAHRARHFGFAALCGEMAGVVGEAASELAKTLKGMAAETTIHIGGFTDGESLELIADGNFDSGTAKLPKTQSEVVIGRSPAGKSAFFSGVRITRLTGGRFRVDGFDTETMAFMVTPPSLSGASGAVRVGESDLVEYAKYQGSPVRLPYGTVFTRRQSLHDFLMGLGNRLRSEGFDLPVWTEMAREAAEWAESGPQPEFMFSGFDGALSWNGGDHGAVAEIGTGFAGDSSLLDRGGDPIPPHSVFALRSGGGIELRERVLGPRSGIFGAALEMEEISHVAVVRGEGGLPGTEVYNPVMGRGLDRIRLRGQRSKGWNGRIDAPGYLVREGGMSASIESGVREIEHDWVNVQSRAMNRMTRDSMGATFGNSMPDYHARAGIGEDAARMRGAGERMAGASRHSLQAMGRSAAVTGEPFEGKIREHWMISKGGYGDASEAEPLEFTIDPAKIKGGRQIIRFNTTSGTDSPADSVIDVYKPDVISGNHEHPFEQYPFLPADNRSVGLAGEFQRIGRNSGMLLRSDVDYFVNSIDEIGNVYDSGAPWATIPNWSKSSSYQKGDVVRHGGRVHRLTKDSTGISRVSGEVVIRGSEVSPRVENSSTLILNGETISFAKTAQSVVSNPITVTGNKNDISFAGPKEFHIDTSRVTLEKTRSVGAKILDGTIPNPTIQNSADREIKIEYDSDGSGTLSALYVNFNEERDFETAREVWGDLFTEAKKVTTDINVTAETTARLRAFEDFRSSYIDSESSSEWKEWLDETYFGFTAAIHSSATIAIDAASKIMTVAGWTNHGYAANQKVTFSGVNGIGAVYTALVRAAINGTHTVKEVSDDGNSFKIALPGSPPAMTAAAATSGKVTKETPDRIVNPVEVAKLVKDQIAGSGTGPYTVKPNAPDWATAAHGYLQSDIDIMGDVTGDTPSDRDKIYASVKDGPALPASFGTIMDNANSMSFTKNSNARTGLRGDAGIVAFAKFVVASPTTAIAAGTEIPVADPDPNRYKVDGADDIVRKIKAAAPAGFEVLKLGGGRIRIRMDGRDESRLRIGADSDLGFTEGQNGVSIHYAVQVLMDADDVASAITDANVRGVNARTDNDKNLVIRSVNPKLVIGNGSANPLVGFSAGSYDASFSRPTIVVDLDIGDVVAQINAANIPGLAAREVDGALIIRFSGEGDLDIGSGTANETLGISSGTFERAGGAASNPFNAADWEAIPEPAEFSILVVNTIGSDGVAPETSADYDILRTINFNLDVVEICAGLEYGDDALVKTDKPHGLARGERVLIVNSTCVPSVDGIHKVTRIAGGANPTGFFIDRFIEEKGFDGKVIPIRSVKFANSKEAESALGKDDDNKYVGAVSGTGILDGALIYTDRENKRVSGIFTSELEQGGAVYAVARQGNAVGSLNRKRGENPKTRNDKFSGAVLRTVRDGRVLSDYEVFDPLKGIIPRAADSAIDIRSDRDSAIYNATTDPARPTDEGGRWGKEQVGTVWWDLSTAIYYDYEQGGLADRREFWGRLLPGSSIDVYQWTKSPVPPEEYADAAAAGTVIDGTALSGIPYSFRAPAGDVHHYWCEDQEYNPGTGRFDTVHYFWVRDKIDPGAGRRLSVSQIASMIEDPSSAGIDWFAATGTDALILGNLDRHADAGDLALRVRADRSGVDHHQEWILLKECDPEDRVPQWLHDGLRDSLAGFTREITKRTASVYDASATYDAGDLVKVSASATGYWECMNDTTRGELPGAVSSGTMPDKWSRFDVAREYVDGEFAGKKGEWLVEVENTRKVPEDGLHPLARVGNSKRPNQTWFENVPAARRTAFEEINAWLARTDLAREFPDWDEVFGERIKRGERIVDIGATWERIDWIAPDAPPFDPAAPDHRVRNAGGLAALGASEGQTALLEEEREIRMLSDGAWKAVWKKAGTAMFRESLYAAPAAGGYGSAPWGNSPGTEIAEILDLLRTRVWIGDWECRYSEFWFRMLKHIVSEQRDVDWIVKSGYFEYEIEGDMLRRPGVSEGKDLSDAFAHATAIKPFTSKIKDMTDFRKANATAHVGTDTGVAMTFETTLKGMSDTVVDEAGSGDIMLYDVDDQGVGAWFSDTLRGDFRVTAVDVDEDGEENFNLNFKVIQSAVGIPELKVAGSGTANDVLMRSSGTPGSATELEWNPVTWSFETNSGVGIYEFTDVSASAPADNQIMLHDGSGFKNVTVSGAMASGSLLGSGTVVFGSGKIEQRNFRTSEGFTGQVASKVVQAGALGQTQSLTFEPGYVHSAINDVIVEVNGEAVRDGFTVGSGSIAFEGASGFGSGFSAGDEIKVYVANSLSGSGRPGQVLIGNGRGGYEWKDPSVLEYGLQDIDDVAEAGASQYTYGGWSEVSGVSGTNVDFNSTSLPDGVGIFTAIESGDAGRRPTRPWGGEAAKWWEHEGAYAVWTEGNTQRILAAANEYFWLRERTRPAGGAWGNWGDWKIGANFFGGPTDDEARKYRETTFDESAMTSGRPNGPWVVDMADPGIADRPPLGNGAGAAVALGILSLHPDNPTHQRFHQEGYGQTVHERTRTQRIESERIVDSQVMAYDDGDDQWKNRSVKGDFKLDGGTLTLEDGVVDADALDVSGDGDEDDYLTRSASVGSGSADFTWSSSLPAMTLEGSVSDFDAEFESEASGDLIIHDGSQWSNQVVTGSFTLSSAGSMDAVTNTVEIPHMKTWFKLFETTIPARFGPQYVPYESPFLESGTFSRSYNFVDNPGDLVVKATLPGGSAIMVGTESETPDVDNAMHISEHRVAFDWDASGDAGAYRDSFKAPTTAGAADASGNDLDLDRVRDGDGAFVFEGDASIEKWQYRIKEVTGTAVSGTIAYDHSAMKVTVVQASHGFSAGHIVKFAGLTGGSGNFEKLLDALNSGETLPSGGITLISNGFEFVLTKHPEGYSGSTDVAAASPGGGGSMFRMPAAESDWAGNPSSPWTDIPSEAGINEPKHPVEDLKPGRHYWVQIKSVNGKGESEPSAAASITTKAASPGATPVISSMEATGPFAVKITASISGDGGAVITKWKYRVSTSNPPTGNYITVDADEGSPNTFTVTQSGLAQEKTHYADVIAVNSVGDSPVSDVSSATTPADSVAPPQPTLTAVTAGERSITIEGTVSTTGGADIDWWQYVHSTSASMPSVPADSKDSDGNDTGINTVANKISGTTLSVSKNVTTKGRTSNSLDRETRGYFWIRAHNKRGYSPWSAVQSAATHPIDTPFHGGVGSAGNPYLMRLLDTPDRKDFKDGQNIMADLKKNNKSLQSTNFNYMPSGYRSRIIAKARIGLGKRNITVRGDFKTTGSRNFRLILAYHRPKSVVVVGNKAGTIGSSGFLSFTVNADRIREERSGNGWHIYLLAGSSDSTWNPFTDVDKVSLQVTEGNGNPSTPSVNLSASPDGGQLNLKADVSDNGGANITQWRYKIATSRAGLRSAAEVTVTAGGNTFSRAIRKIGTADLDKDTRYYVDVQARNSSGWSKWGSDDARTAKTKGWFKKGWGTRSEPLVIGKYKDFYTARDVLIDMRVAHPVYNVTIANNSEKIFAAIDLPAIPHAPRVMEIEAKFAAANSDYRMFLVEKTGNKLIDWAKAEDGTITLRTRNDRTKDFNSSTNAKKVANPSGGLRLYIGTGSDGFKSGHPDGLTSFTLSTRLSPGGFAGGHGSGDSSYYFHHNWRRVGSRWNKQDQWEMHFKGTLLDDGGYSAVNWSATTHGSSRSGRGKTAESWSGWRGGLSWRSSWSEDNSTMTFTNELGSATKNSNWKKAAESGASASGAAGASTLASPQGEPPPVIQTGSPDNPYEISLSDYAEAVDVSDDVKANYTVRTQHLFTDGGGTKSVRAFARFAFDLEEKSNVSVTAEFSPDPAGGGAVSIHLCGGAVDEVDFGKSADGATATAAGTLEAGRASIHLALGTLDEHGWGAGFPDRLDSLTLRVSAEPAGIAADDGLAGGLTGAYGAAEGAAGPRVADPGMDSPVAAPAQPTLAVTNLKTTGSGTNQKAEIRIDGTYTPRRAAGLPGSSGVGPDRKFSATRDGFEVGKGTLTGHWAQWRDGDVQYQIVCGGSVEGDLQPDFENLPDGALYHRSRTKGSATVAVGTGTTLSGAASSVTVTHSGHGLETGGRVWFDGLKLESGASPAGGQALLNALNGVEHDVTSISSDAFTVPVTTASGTAIASGQLADAGEMIVWNDWSDWKTGRDKHLLHSLESRESEDPAVFVPTARNFPPDPNAVLKPSMRIRRPGTGAQEGWDLHVPGNAADSSKEVKHATDLSAGAARFRLGRTLPAGTAVTGLVRNTRAAELEEEGDVFSSNADGSFSLDRVTKFFDAMTPASGDMLLYDADGGQRWENRPIGSSGPHSLSVSGLTVSAADGVVEFKGADLPNVNRGSRTVKAKIENVAITGLNSNSSIVGAINGIHVMERLGGVGHKFSIPSSAGSTPSAAVTGGTITYLSDLEVADAATIAVNANSLRTNATVTISLPAHGYSVNDTVTFKGVAGRAGEALGGGAVLTAINRGSGHTVVSAASNSFAISVSGSNFNSTRMTHSLSGGTIEVDANDAGSSASVAVRIPNHKFSAGDSVTFSGVAAGPGLGSAVIASLESGAHTVGPNPSGGEFKITVSGSGLSDSAFAHDCREISSISVSGTAATVNLLSHGFKKGDTISFTGLAGGLSSATNISALNALTAESAVAVNAAGLTDDVFKFTLSGLATDAGGAPTGGIVRRHRDLRRDIRTPDTVAISGTSLTVGMASHQYEAGDSVVFEGFSSGTLAGLTEEQATAINGTPANPVAAASDGSFTVTISGLSGTLSAAIPTGGSIHRIGKPWPVRLSAGTATHENHPYVPAAGTVTKGTGADAVTKTLALGVMAIGEGVVTEANLHKTEGDRDGVAGTGLVSKGDGKIGFSVSDISTKDISDFDLSYSDSNPNTLRIGDAEWGTWSGYRSSASVSSPNSIAIAGGVMTVALTNHGFKVGDSIKISGVDGGSLHFTDDVKNAINATHTVAVVPTANVGTFQVTLNPVPPNDMVLNAANRPTSGVVTHGSPTEFPATISNLNTASDGHGFFSADATGIPTGVDEGGAYASWTDGSTQHQIICYGSENSTLKFGNNSTGAPNDQWNSGTRSKAGTNINRGGSFDSVLAPAYGIFDNDSGDNQTGKPNDSSGGWHNDGAYVVWESEGGLKLNMLAVTAHYYAYRSQTKANADAHFVTSKWDDWSYTSSNGTTLNSDDFASETEFTNAFVLDNLNEMDAQDTPKVFVYNSGDTENLPSGRAGIPSNKNEATCIVFFTNSGGTYPPSSNVGKIEQQRAMNSYYGPRYWDRNVFDNARGYAHRSKAVGGAWRAWTTNRGTGASGIATHFLTGDSDFNDATEYFEKRSPPKIIKMGSPNGPNGFPARPDRTEWDGTYGIVVDWPATGSRTGQRVISHYLGSRYWDRTFTRNIVAEGDAVIHDGTSWKNLAIGGDLSVASDGTVSINAGRVGTDILNVDGDGADGQRLAKGSGSPNFKWSSEEIVDELDEMTDVDTDGASANNILVREGSNWVPKSVAGDFTFNASGGLQLIDDAVTPVKISAGPTGTADSFIGMAGTRPGFVKESAYWPAQEEESPSASSASVIPLEGGSGLAKVDVSFDFEKVNGNLDLQVGSGGRIMPVTHTYRYTQHVFGESGEETETDTRRSGFLLSPDDGASGSFPGAAGSVELIRTTARIFTFGAWGGWTNEGMDSVNDFDDIVRDAGTGTAAQGIFSKAAVDKNSAPDFDYGVAPPPKASMTLSPGVGKITVTGWLSEAEDPLAPVTGWRIRDAATSASLESAAWRDAAGVAGAGTPTMSAEVGSLAAGADRWVQIAAVNKNTTGHETPNSAPSNESRSAVGSATTAAVPGSPIISLAAGNRSITVTSTAAQTHLAPIASWVIHHATDASMSSATSITVGTASTTITHTISSLTNGDGILGAGQSGQSSGGRGMVVSGGAGDTDTARDGASCAHCESLTPGNNSIVVTASVADDGGAPILRWEARHVRVFGNAGIGDMGERHRHQHRCVF